MEGYIFLGIICLVGILALTYYIINTKNLNKTKHMSNMYKKIIEVNEKYAFNSDIEEEIKFSPCLKSKRSLDKFDMSAHVMSDIVENKSYYKTIFNKVEENISLYKSYLTEYSKIENYMTEEEYSKLENPKISLKTLNKCEQKLYNKNKYAPPITSVQAHCHATYTSPSGRNHYWRDAYFDYDDLKSFFSAIERKELFVKQEAERKAKLAEEKRAKEKKLRELDKLEKKLAEKEQEINKKEKEFLEATKEHIYTTDNVAIDNAEIEIDENLTISQKMKLLREKFDNGEITYEEYQAKRKELM